MTAAVLIKSHLKDADMQATSVALARAAKRARDLAAKTGTPLVVIEAGKLVRKVPKRGA